MPPQRLATALAMLPVILLAGGSPRSTAADPVGDCAVSVAYWTRQLLSPGGDEGLDYQEMGLSDGEYTIVRALVPTTRPVAVSKGLQAAQNFALDQARPRCRAYLAALPTASATLNGWAP